jgi:hypothetical protein
VTPSEQSRVIRPAAILRETEATALQRLLEEQDVSLGGVWNVGPGVWQRYDKPWDGVGGMSGSARLLGTIGVVYGAPSRYEITIYRVTVSAAGRDDGWTVDSICDDALGQVGLTLDELPRADLTDPPSPDPFRRA